MAMLEIEPETFHSKVSLPLATLLRPDAQSSTALTNSLNFIIILLLNFPASLFTNFCYKFIDLGRIEGRLEGIMIDMM